MPVELVVDGEPVSVPDSWASASLLDVLREHLRITSVKDGCAPQGQCGCCTVLVDGQPRVACVTAVRRVAGRSITTVDGLPAEVRDPLVDSFVAHGASQCGFCTPGILCRLAAGPADVTQAMLAHLCRCTGWQTIVSACSGGAVVGGARPDAAARAALEGGVPQAVGPDVVLGRGGFADDTAPADALVAVPDGAGGWAVGATVLEARAVAGKVQGRRTTVDVDWPVAVPEGDWVRTLQTTWVEPAYLEPDASWCAPGGEPASPVANGGAFGGKASSLAPVAAQALADEHGRPVRVVFSREDTVRMGPKRPPMAAGIRADGTGVVRIVRTPGIAAAVQSLAPGLVVEEIDVPGPPTSCSLRGAGWAEAAVLLSSLGPGPDTVRAPGGGSATAVVDDSGVHVTVSCGAVLDAVVLRSYVIGAAHMALGWVWSEGIAVDPEGTVLDLTIRSFGVLRARDMPPVHVELVDRDDPAVNGSDAVFAAVAAAAWRHAGFPPRFPIHPGGLP